MTMNPREEGFETKKEGESDYNKFPNITSSSSRQWSSFKNPRIVRVSRTSGGKDRHSKVSTVRGLRDRRIRLSVPTAIQLYDLQDRLGLSQPSKVVDWLLDATKDEIDKLPPLPMIPSSFAHQFHQPTLPSDESSAVFLSDILTANEVYAKGLGINQSKQKIEKETMAEKNKWIAFQQEVESEEGFGGFVAQLSAQNLFPLSSQFSVQNLPYNSNFFHSDPPNLCLSQFGGGYTFSSQPEEQSHSSLSSSFASTSQLYMCPYATNISSTNPPFPSYIPPSMDNDHLRQINHLENVQQNSSILPTALHLITSPMKSFSLSMESKAVDSQENDTRKQDKDKRSS